MKGLCILVLLSSALQLYRASPALEPVTCGDSSGAAAARLSMHHINEHHDQGFKFNLSEIQGSKVEEVGDGCNIELHLELRETECHVVNPKHFEDCELSRRPWEVLANCTVTVTVRNTNAEVTKYHCDTRRALTNAELVRTCPDCPPLIALNSPEGLKAVTEAVKRINLNATNQHYYKLQEVARVKTGYIPGSGMQYYVQFALVETQCPRESDNPGACTLFSPDRPGHAFCRASYSAANGLTNVECEFYPPSVTTAPVPAEQDKALHHIQDWPHV